MEVNRSSSNENEGLRVAGPTLRLFAVAVALCVGLVAFALFLDSRSGISVPRRADRVNVTLSSYGITYEPSPVIPHGEIAFVVTNDGAIPHEFVMFETKLSANRLPLRSDGDVDEGSPLMRDVLDSGPSLAPHSTKVFVATLAPGHYAAVCNLPGHYRLGMRLDVTVR